MPDRPCSAIAAMRLPGMCHLLPSLACCLSSLCFFGVVSVSAEVRVISSQGEFRMGDRDTREDAMRLATEAAKRNALEQVATYLESVTVIEGTDVTRDEIKTYTAGLILVLDQQANLRLDGDVVVVAVELTSQIDTEEVAQAILALREHESARHQLAALHTEIDELHRELEAANLSLAAAVTAEEAQQASVQRQDILDRVQSNAMVSQVWTDWAVVAPGGYFASWGAVPPQGLLNAARSLYPASPHVQAAEELVVMNPAGHGHLPGARSMKSRTLPRNCRSRSAASRRARVPWHRFRSSLAVLHPANRLRPSAPGRADHSGSFFSRLQASRRPVKRRSHAGRRSRTIMFHRFLLPGVPSLSLPVALADNIAAADVGALAHAVGVVVVGSGEEGKS